MSVLVVMPALNEADYIVGALVQVLDSCADLDVRLVVADGGSTDGTRAILTEIAAQDDRVDWIDNPGRTQACGIDLAVAMAGDDVDIVVRADCHAAYPPDFVHRVVSSLDQRRSEGCVSVVVPMIASGQRVFQRAAAATQNSLLGNGGSAHRRLGASRYVDHGHHAAFDRAAFDAVAGYDIRMTENEDAELDVRLAAVGGRVFLETQAAITYFPRRTWSGLARQYVRHGRGRAWNTLKHHSRPRVRQLAPAAITATTIAAVLLAPRHPKTLVAPATYVATCLAVGVAHAVSRRDPALLLMGPIGVVTHHSWGIGFLGGLLRSPDFRVASTDPPAPA